MKTRIRPDDISTLEMSDWVAQLRDADSDSAGPGSPEPETPATALPVTGSPATGSGVSPEVSAGDDAGQRAAIGDQLRKPIAWCEIGPCIARYSHPAALGEADIRARAISAGWKVDGLGRLVCPDCQQSNPSFCALHPVVPWDRDVAVARVAGLAADVGQEVVADDTAGMHAEMAAVIHHPAAGPPYGHRAGGRHRKQP